MLGLPSQETDLHVHDDWAAYYNVATARSPPPADSRGVTGVHGMNQVSGIVYCYIGWTNKSIDAPSRNARGNGYSALIYPAGS